MGVRNQSKSGRWHRACKGLGRRDLRPVTPLEKAEGPGLGKRLCQEWGYLRAQLPEARDLFSIS